MALAKVPPEISGGYICVVVGEAGEHTLGYIGYLTFTRRCYKSVENKFLKFACRNAFNIGMIPLIFFCWGADSITFMTPLAAFEYMWFGEQVKIIENKSLFPKEILRLPMLFFYLAIRLLKKLLKRLLKIGNTYLRFK
jgi:hypothetical protein